jgi:hypothetical protein
MDEACRMNLECSPATVMLCARLVIQHGGKVDYGQFGKTYFPRDSVGLRESRARQAFQLARDEIAAEIAENDAELAVKAGLKAPVEETPE